MNTLSLIKLDQCGNFIWNKSKSFTNTGAPQIILTKFNSDGDSLFTKTYNTIDGSTMLSPSIANDSDNNTYLAFSTNGIPSSILFNIIIIKLDSNGNLIWSKYDFPFNDIKNNISPKIQIDGSDNIYLNFVSYDETDIYDVVVAKLNSDGDMLWITQSSFLSASSDNINNSMDIDGLGNTYVAHQILNYDKYDISVFKVNNLGQIIWTNNDSAFNTTKDNTNPSITVDIYGNSYIAYNTDGIIPNNFNTVNSGGYDIVLFKLNTNGLLIWKAQNPAFNTIDNDTNPQIVVDNKENLYLVYVSTVKCSIIRFVKFVTKCCFDCCKNCCQSSCNVCFPKVCLSNPGMCKDIKCLEIKKKNCDVKFNILLEKVNNILCFYHQELLSIKKSQKVINMIVNTLNELSSNETQNKFLLAEVNKLVDTYCNESNKIYGIHRIDRNCNFNIYGTVDSHTGMPVTYVNGFGGIRNKKITGNLILTLDKINYFFNFNDVCSVFELSKIISQKLCTKLAIINGLEISIKINCVPAHIVIELCVSNCNIIKFEYCAKNKTKETYLDLLNKLYKTFSDYIQFICYDCNCHQLNIIFKKGYTLLFYQKKKCPCAQFIIKTFVNCIPVNYGTISLIRKRYVYGYLLFYNNQNNFCVQYPDGSLSQTKVIPVLLKENFQYYCENICFDLSDLIKCKINTIEAAHLSAGNFCSKYDIKYYCNYATFLKKIIKCIKNCSSICNVRKYTNVVNMLCQYNNMLIGDYNLITITSSNFLDTVKCFLK
ncbi:hypothetical protein Catovirus_1_732 [Catovirus CTV1]|uniref:Bulb-type lectin domain-containing protein n=1 Tax=Catovirus CTV1 TaxID=1977631 RepID=A0A1V0SAE4_9VIRU|nr:hypothetical protein Catovirus_1_732 [Catovirus CTV1]